MAALTIVKESEKLLMKVEFSASSVSSASGLEKYLRAKKAELFKALLIALLEMVFNPFFTGLTTTIDVLHKLWSRLTRKTDRTE